ncbi:hypothetical protein [Spirosoma pulveris]
MDIVFQFGEFTNDGSMWADLFVAIVGTSLGGIITVSVYRAQIRHTKLEDEYKKGQQEIDRLVYFTAMINRVVPVVTNQAEEIDKFTNAIDENPLYIPQIGVYPLNDIERLANKIDHSEYYRSFYNQNKDTPESINSFNKLYSGVDFFDSQIKRMLDHAEATGKRDHESRLALKNLAAIASNAFDDLKLRVSKEPKNKDVYKELNLLTKIYLEKVTGKQDDLSIQNDQFFVPAIGILKPFIKDDDDFYKLFMKICEAQNAYSSIIHSNERISKEFKGLREMLSKALSSVNEHIHILDRYKEPSSPPRIPAIWWRFWKK